VPGYRARLSAQEAGGGDEEMTMEGKFIAVRVVPMCDGGSWPGKTVLYERDGRLYRGVEYDSTPVNGPSVKTYYFGGGGNLAFSSDVDEAWERAYS
jgi:hypothetical protein